MQFCVPDMQQQLNLNAPVCVPAGPSCLFSCPNVAGVSSPAPRRAVLRTIIHGVPVRSPVQYAGAGAVVCTRVGGPVRHPARRCNVSHPPTTCPYLLAPATSCFTPIYAKVFEIRSFVRQKRLPLMPNLFQPTLEVERQQTASMAPFRIIHTAAG